MVTKMSDDTPVGEIRKEDAHLLDVRLVILSMLVFFFFNLKLEGKIE